MVGGALDVINTAPASEVAAIPAASAARADVFLDVTLVSDSG
jgi:hypothetical protein